MEQVVDLLPGGVGPHAQRRGTLLPTPRSVCAVEVAARAWIEAGCRVRRRCGLSDLAPGAVALVGDRRQLRQGLPVAGILLGLRHDRAVEGEAEGREVAELVGGDGSIGSVAVQILHPQPQATSRGVGEQPRQHGRAQVAQVQRGRRRRRVPPIALVHESSCARRASLGERWSSQRHASRARPALVTWEAIIRDPARLPGGRPSDS